MGNHHVVDGSACGVNPEGTVASRDGLEYVSFFDYCKSLGDHRLHHGRCEQCPVGFVVSENYRECVTEWPTYSNCMLPEGQTCGPRSQFSVKRCHAGPCAVTEMR